MSAKLYKNKRQIFIVVVILAILIFSIIAGWLNTSKNQSVVFLEDVDISLSVDGKQIDTNNPGEVWVESLEPEFTVSLLGSTILSVEINGVTAFSQDQATDNTVSFKSPFLLKPGKIELGVNYQDQYGDSVLRDYTFSLGYLEKFNYNIDEIDFLIIPDSTSRKNQKSWFTQDGVLRVSSIADSSHASLAFLYPLSSPTVTFELVPNGSTLNLTFYFLDSGYTFFIGNGNNRDHVLIRDRRDIGISKAVGNARLELTKENKYYIVINKDSNGTYSLAVNGKDHNALSGDRIITFREEDHTQNPNFVGFSVMSGSDGFSIDNLRVIDSD